MTFYRSACACSQTMASGLWFHRRYNSGAWTVATYSMPCKITLRDVATSSASGTTLTDSKQLSVCDAARNFRIHWRVCELYFCVGSRAAVKACWQRRLRGSPWGALFVFARTISAVIVRRQRRPLSNPWKMLDSPWAKCGTRRQRPEPGGISCSIRTDYTWQSVFALLHLPFSESAGSRFLTRPLFMLRWHTSPPYLIYVAISADLSGSPSVRTWCWRLQWRHMLVRRSRQFSVRRTCWMRTPGHVRYRCT
mmetsp:Transcript_11914/g.23123  ORF Transcript_11914/g.23123 Transcript_11914/m.23123 type:complete len:251 (+) Transcript_11914:674-1426(+)